jgi:hypothetical protein
MISMYFFLPPGGVTKVRAKYNGCYRSRSTWEVPMATVKNIKINNYCDTVSHELSEMKEGIHIIREEAKKTYGVESEQFRKYDAHLCELADMIDWKFQLLMKACPFDWKGGDQNIESDVSVESLEKLPEIDFSGGYIGG